MNVHWILTFELPSSCHKRPGLGLPYVLVYKLKNLWQFCPSKLAAAAIDLYVGHKFFRKADDVSWARHWRTLRPIARRSAAVGQWHVTWYCSKMNGQAGEEYSAFCTALSLGRSPTWAWLAHDWHRKWRCWTRVHGAASHLAVISC